MIGPKELPRTVPGAEFFFGESVAQYLADLSDEAYSAEASAEGFLLGGLFHDPIGEYVVVSGLTQDLSRIPDSVGWFRSSSEGAAITTSDIRRIISLFGYRKVYSIVVDSDRGEMGMYSVENGVARKVPSAMVDNL